MSGSALGAGGMSDLEPMELVRGCIDVGETLRMSSTGGRFFGDSEIGRKGLLNDGAVEGRVVLP